MTWTRPVRDGLVAAVWTAGGSIRWMNAAVLFRWKGPGAATPSARRTAIVSSLPSRPSVPAGKRSAGAYTSIMGIAKHQVRAGFRALQRGQVHEAGCRPTLVQLSAELRSALLGLFERGDQRAKSGIAIVSRATNEERRRPVDTALDATHEVFSNSPQMDMLSNLVLEPLHVQLEFLRIVGEESMVAEGRLILIEKIMHLPELPLDGGRLGGFRGPFRLRVGGGNGEVSENEPELRPEFLLDLLHDRVGRPAVGTLVVPVLDEHHSSIGRSLHMVPFSDGQAQSRRSVIRGRHDHSPRPGDLSFSSAERIPSAPGLTPSCER